MPASCRVVLPMLLMSAVLISARAVSAGCGAPCTDYPAPAVPPEKTVYLTFDDGPSEITLTILDALKEHEAAATFFVCGNVTEFGNTVYNRFLDEGHALGNQKFSHRYSTYISADAPSRMWPWTIITGSGNPAGSSGSARSIIVHEGTRRKSITCDPNRMAIWATAC